MASPRAWIFFGDMQMRSVSQSARICCFAKLAEDAQEMPSSADNLALGQVCATEARLITMQHLSGGRLGNASKPV
jgi:hypothetical protein